MFRDSSRDLANSQDDLQNALTAEIWSVPFISFTHIIHTLITHKIGKEAIQKTTLERFLQQTHLVRESYSSSIEKSLQSLLFSLSHCYTLRGNLYPNTTHTYSDCREWFGAWEALEVCQNKPMRLGECNRVILRDLESCEDRILRILLVVGAWKAQVL